MKQAIFDYLEVKQSEALACFGTEGSFTENALFSVFGDAQAHVSYENFDDLLDAITDGVCRLGIAPIENSTSGSILQVLDGIEARGLSICGEVQLAIRQHLCAKPGADIGEIDTVYSHAQGFLQCTGFFQEHKNIRREVRASTSESAEYVALSSDRHLAAICGETAMKRHGLVPLLRDVQDAQANTTRFVFLSRDPIACPHAGKASLSFTVSHRSGSLVKVLGALATHQINMTKIESRPIAHERWQYRFFVDLTMPAPDDLHAALGDAVGLWQSGRLLGCYGVWCRDL